LHVFVSTLAPLTHLLEHFSADCRSDLVVIYATERTANIPKADYAIDRGGEENVVIAGMSNYVRDLRLVFSGGRCTKKNR